MSDSHKQVSQNYCSWASNWRIENQRKVKGLYKGITNGQPEKKNTPSLNRK